MGTPPDSLLPLVRFFCESPSIKRLLQDNQKSLIVCSSWWTADILPDNLNFLLPAQAGSVWHRRNAPMSYTARTDSSRQQAAGYEPRHIHSQTFHYWPNTIRVQSTDMSDLWSSEPPTRAWAQISSCSSDPASQSILQHSKAMLWKKTSPTRLHKGSLQRSPHKSSCWSISCQYGIVFEKLICPRSMSPTHRCNQCLQSQKLPGLGWA